MPLLHLGAVLRSTTASVILGADVRPGGGISRFCRPSMPLLHLGAVLPNLVLLIHKTEVVPRGFIPLFCRTSVPLRRLGEVLRNTFAFVVHEAEDKLGDVVSLLRL